MLDLEQEPSIGDNSPPAEPTPANCEVRLDWQTDKGTETLSTQPYTPKDALLTTPQGLLTLTEVFQRNGLEPTIASKKVSKSIELFNRDGRAETTTAVSYRSRRPVWTIETASGNRIVSTAKRRHLTLNRWGHLVWTDTQTLKEGDHLASLRSYGTRIGRTQNYTDAQLYLLGVLLADGSFQDKRIAVTNNDPYVKECIVGHGPTLFGVEARAYAKVSQGSFDFHFNSTANVQTLYGELGWTSGRAKDKHLGPVLRTLTTPQIRKVLQGYFDCECAIDESGIEVVSASWKLLFEVKTALQAHFGIISVLNERAVAGYEHNQYWRLTLYGPAARRYVEQIGFDSAVRKSEAVRLDSVLQAKTIMDVIPNCGPLVESLYDASETTRSHGFEARDYKGAYPKASLTYRSLADLLKLDWSDCAALDRLREIHATNYFYDRVTSVQRSGVEATFEFEVPHSHSTVTANIVTNSLIL